ncbi:GNAT family N-acetyltransferase [Streptomyces arenae]|nr:GNAT family N-acetyltransferase [Streptomyces arenae]
MRRDRAADAADGHPVLRVRERAGERDMEACIGVLAQVHRSDGYPVNWPDQPGDWLDGGAGSGAWVAELDGRVVGHVGLFRPGAGDEAPVLWGERAGTGAGGAAVVGRLFVAPEARGHGIGALLMGRVVREARSRGLHPVLDVVSSDAAAAALYESLGWRLLAVVEQEWQPGQRVALRCYAAPDDACAAASRSAASSPRTAG